MLASLKYLLMVVLVGSLFLLTRSDLSNIRVLATDSSFFTTQIAEVTRLEKEFLLFRLTANRFTQGHQGLGKADVRLAFEILRARVDSERERFKNPRITVLREFGPDLARFQNALRAIDPLVESLQPGDEASLAKIEEIASPSVAAMARMNAHAYGELYHRTIGLAESQSAALASLNHFQLVYFAAVAAALILLAINLRRGGQLNRQLLAREAEIREIAMVDPLTGLYNRRYFDDRMVSLGKERSLEATNLMIVDLDGFKAVNDNHGHIVGDLMLREIALRIKQIAETSAILTRIGGDEFGIIHSGSLDHALIIANALVAAIRLPVVLPDHILSAGASIGIASLGEDPGTAENLLDHADRALYEAKARGRNCVVIYRAAEKESSVA